MTQDFVLLARNNWLRTMLVWAILLPVFTARATTTESLILVLPAESKTVPHVFRDAGRSLSLKDGHQLAIEAALAHAKLTQAPVLERLAELAESYEITNIRSFWVANAISFECSPRLIPLLEQWPDVAVERDLLLELIPISQPVNMDRRRSLDDGVSAALLDIRAPEAWELGLTGVNVLLASFDSGVNGTHPGLAPRWRGNNGHPASECWLDLVEPITSIPGDNDGHGTLTMGLQCGMVTGDTVGVAWNAQFISAAVAEGGFTITNALQAFEWIVDPDGNPATFEDVPRVLSNSWGFNGGIEICNNVLFDAMDLAEAAGIAVLWSAGNEGPPSGTIRNPANRADNLVSGFCVGGWDGVVDSVWVSSSRGPTPCSEDSILRVKPELVAPARSVRSTYLGTAFASSNGTSFSAPLAAGTIALMIEANPMLSPDSLLELLMLTAADVDVPGLDNSSGYGKLDALMACQAALTGVGWVRGRVQNQQGLGVAAEIALVNYPHSTRSNSNGDFLLPLPAYLPFGLQILANGYAPQSRQVTIEPNDTTYVTFTLTATAQGILTGNVIDCRGVPAVGAYVNVVGAGVPTVATDGNGRFAMTMNPGTYSVACSSGVCGSTQVPGIQIVAGAITDIEVVLPLNPAFQCSPEDPYGYFLCDSNDPAGPAPGLTSISPSQDGKGIIHNLPDDGHVPLALPFPVRFYNQSYNRIFLNSNGIVSFVRLATAFNNLQLPYNLTPALFPFWDDFSDNLGGQILSDYDPAHGTFTLEWYEVPYWIQVPPPTDSANFQVVIYDQAVLPTQSGNNVIEFRYGRIPRNNGCTIGIDRASGGGYVRYGYNGTWESHAVPVEEDLAIRIADEQVSSGVPSFALEPAAFSISLGVGESLDTSLFIHNLGNAPLAYSASAGDPATSSQGQDTIWQAIEYPDYPKGYSPPRTESRDAQLDEWLPDIHGYAWRTSRNDTSVHYSFLDISNGLGTDLGIAHDDTTSYPRPLPFEFELYGRAFKKYSVCSNGFISFWSNSKNYVNDHMSYGRDPYYALAPYWTDLNPEASGDIFEYYDAENERFIVQWNEIRPFNAPGGNNLTFQTILYPDGGINFVYEHMRALVALKTVGIKGGTSSEFLELSYNGTLVDSLLTIRIARPDTAASSVRILSGHYDVVPPFGVNELRVRITNNSVSQGLLALPIHIESSDPAVSMTELTVAMQGGVAFEPRTVLIAAGDSLRLHWQSHPLDSYAIWTALPNDTVFVPYASAIADTHLTIAIPSDLARIYAVKLTGAPAPSAAEYFPNILSPSK
jgi:hypothetical protein